MKEFTVQGAPVLTSGLRPECVVCDDLGCEFCPSSGRVSSPRDGDRTAAQTGALQEARLRLRLGASLGATVLHAAHAAALDRSEVDALTHRLRVV